MKKKLFNDNWLFWNSGDSFALVWNVPDHAKTVHLPHDAMIEEQPYADSKNGGNTGFRDGHNYVYLKQMECTKEDLSTIKILTFEGSYMNTFVYVNGQLAGKHYNGYTVFYVPIHEYLQIGQNEIRVEVRNAAMNNSRWYSGSGLYRDVYLLESDKLYIKETGTTITTRSIEAAFAEIEISVPVINAGFGAKAFSVNIEVFNQENQRVQSELRPYYIKSHAQSDITLRLGIDKPTLWSTETPYLYQVKVQLIVNEEIVDEDSQRFGIRTIQVDSRHGLRINGESINLRGACIHHDSGLLGAATYEAAHRRQISILKAAGFNAIRMSHHPAAPALLTVCDELGMYVMDEAFDMWTRFKGDFDYSLVFEDNWRKDVLSMIQNDYNHPSVILYSIGNEIPEIATLEGSLLAKNMNDFIKQHDHTRPTLAGINGVFASGNQIPQITRDVVEQNKAEGQEIVGNVNDFMSIMESSMDKIVIHPIITKNLELATAATDIAGYNYMSARYEVDAQNYPNRVIVGSETYPPEIARNWKLVQQLSSVIGDFTWTGWDYIGEAGVGVPAYQFGDGGFGAQFPCQLAYSGDIDITGTRRPLSYYREIVFGLREEPYIAVQKPEHFGKQLIKTPWVLSDAISSWTWNGFEDKPIIVEVYAPGDEVALYLNDQLIDKKVVGDSLDYRTLFEITYQPGELKAINYANGEKIAETILKTADSNTMTLYANVNQFDDLSYIDIELRDAEGHLVTDSDQTIVVELEGAELLGFGTGNPKPLEHYLSNSTTTYYGKALLITRKLMDEAKVMITGQVIAKELLW
ncbi:DUF4982 domain-containing protein [Aerococcaceae bacterium zg-BR9]|uniref:glycoside hydrolase family 2 TIM barrel-domain containing protein n=1 Tax=Aerococcaceae bacterium zg-1292 TaxID=2774330 RepID=UPI004062CE6F|nr:DUF4982 domain-containing protein [Aerococcaceae bacterium zg-BR9]